MSRDIPIIFSAPMVRALLDGRKTMTRRILKPQPVPFFVDVGKYCDVTLHHGEGEPRPRVTLGRVITKQEIRFAPGDRLWVRENLIPGSCGFDYDAGGDESLDLSDLTEDQVEFWNKRAGDDPDQSPKVSCIHMPRWASRLTLIVTGVKIERVQDISEADACAEGAIAAQFDEDTGKFFETPRGSHRTGFAGLWSHLHGADAWDHNPFVVAITFRVIKANIDAEAARVAA